MNEIPYVYEDSKAAGFVAARHLASQSGCIKQPVGAAVFDKDFGLLGAGSNDVAHPPLECPRVKYGYPSGRGYSMCKEICQQPRHAEVDAVHNALKCVPAGLLKGASVYIWGHTYCCPACLEFMREAGIAKVVFPTDADTGNNPSVMF